MFETIKEILLEELPLNPDDITMDSKIVEDLGLNSIEQYDLMSACEEKFDIEIKDEDAVDFITVGDVVAFLEKNVKN